MGSIFVRRKKSLAAISAQGPLMQTAPPREACLWADLPACTVLLPCGPAHIKVSWNPISTNRTEAFPIQSEKYSSHQSEWLYSDQSGQCLLNQSNCKDLVSSFAWGQTNQEPGARDFCPCKPAPLWLGEHIFQWSLKSAFPQLGLKRGRCLTGAGSRPWWNEQSRAA